MQLLVLVILMCAKTLWGQDVDPISLKVENSIVIDGKSDDWEHPFKYSNTSSGLSFSMANDDQYMYLCFESTDPIKIVKMLYAGWGIRLVCKEPKRRLNAAITFHTMAMELDPKYDYVAERDSSKPTFKNWLDDYYFEECTYELLGFKGLKKTTLAFKNRSEYGVNVGFSYTKDRATYEMAIPLDYLVVSKHRTQTERLKIRVAINAVNLPDENSKLSVGVGEISGNRRGALIPTEDPPTTDKRRLDNPFDKTGNKESLYYNAAFSTDFQLKE